MTTHKFSIRDCEDLAKSKAGIEGWKACCWERAGDDSIVTGSVPVGTYRSGPRKGRLKFVGPFTKVVVTRSELESAAIAYEATTGLCWDCKGSGRVVVGWSKAEGSRYQSCDRCGGSGKVAS
jgi:hypothetical protein